MKHILRRTHFFDSIIQSMININILYKRHCKMKPDCFKIHPVSVLKNPFVAEEIVLVYSMTWKWTDSTLKEPMMHLPAQYLHCRVYTWGCSVGLSSWIPVIYLHSSKHTNSYFSPLLFWRRMDNVSMEKGFLSTAAFVPLYLNGKNVTGKQTRQKSQFFQ